MVETPLTIRSPSNCSTFWNTPCVAGCVGPKLSVESSLCGSLSSSSRWVFIFIIFQKNNLVYQHGSDPQAGILFASGKPSYHPHSISCADLGDRRTAHQRNRRFRVPSS